MAENKDKFSLDDILNEYTHKSSGGGMDVEDIINETMHSAKIVGAEYNDDKKEEKEPETKTEPKIEANSAEISFKDFDDLDNREEEPEKPYEAEEFEKAKEEKKPAKPIIGDFKLNPMGEILNRFEANADELENVIVGDEEEDGEEITEASEDVNDVYETEEAEDSENSEEESEETEDSELSFSVFDYDDPFGRIIQNDKKSEDEESDTEEESKPEHGGKTSAEDVDYLKKSAAERGAQFRMRTADDGDESKRATKQSEYTAKSDAPKIEKQIAQLKSNLTVRAAVLLFASVFSLFITVANDLSLPLAAVFDRTVNPSAYLFTNTILGIIAVGFSYSVIVMGIKSIFSRRPDSDSIAAVNIIVAILAGLVTLFDPESLKASFFHLYTSAAIIGLLCNTLGKLCIVRRTERNFEFVAGSDNFSAVQLVEDDQTVAYLTNGSAGKRKELATLKRTSFIKDFMKNSYSSDLADSYAEKTTPIMLTAALIVGLLSIVFEKNSAGTEEKLFVFLASISGTLSICSSIALTLIVNLPMANASKKLINYSGVMLGYSSVEEFAEVNSVVIDAGHLFPTGTVEFVNLKMLGSTMIDKGIIYAASMARAGNSITQPAFYKMLRGQIEMTLPVNDCAAEDNLGVVGTIEGNRVLLGNRKLMERHGIEGLPSIPSEEEFADGSCIMYLAVSGKAAMMFAIDLAVGASAERWVQEMEDESIDIHVRCSDGFITRELLANMLDISPSTIRLLPSNCDGDCKQIMSYEESISASMFCSGHLPSFSMLLIAAKRLKFVCNLGIAVQYGAMILGIVISVIMMLTGSFAQITPTIVIIYNLAFLLLTYLMQSMRKI